MSFFKRDATPNRTLLIDRFMTHFIKVGGVGIIAAVLAIFVFIFWQVIPLFKGAEVAPYKSLEIQARPYEILGLDEWAERPFVVTRSGQFFFVDAVGEEGVQEAEWPTEISGNISRLQYNDDHQSVIFATDLAEFVIISIEYEPSYEERDNVTLRRILYSLKASPIYSFFEVLPEVSQYQVMDIDYGASEETQLIIAILQTDQEVMIKGMKLVQESSLLDEGQWEVGNRFDLGSELEETPRFVRVNETADAVIIGTEQGSLYYYYFEDGVATLRQKIEPFAELDDRHITSADFLLGGVSLYVTSPTGANYLYSLSIPEGGTQRIFRKTKDFPALPGPLHFFGKSLRNKAFLAGTGNEASIRYGTTAEVRWQSELPFNAELGSLSRKYQRLAFLDSEAQLHLYSIDDPHPEGGWKAFFGKIWYEGASGPDYAWQSTGGSDAFEPKLSIMPLLVGTLKGTLYAMIFALPISLLAGLYTSQFMNPNHKVFVKPVMEIMASLPSVILGFLAALWLAPILEDQVPSVILCIIALPLFSFVFGGLWDRMPKSMARIIPEGFEVIVMMPFLVLVVYGAWNLGPVLERWLFVVTDPSTGQQVADFRLWWPEMTGASFEQRNSLVVGFIMGFAVIPIIFTITEDSLSSVPMSLRSASLALGASRWQTAWRIVVPTAAAGIFSAIMIGFGRAVGETMIVLMATGNTPIRDFNIFSGFRTLSANLAVELPEAPYQGTLYRTLFLGAMALFIMTFILNTLAELMRQHIRKRYQAL